MDIKESMAFITGFVEQCFAGNYGNVSGNITQVIERISETCSHIESIGIDTEDHRLKQFLLNNIVTALEKDDIYRLCDSLLQISDFFSACFQNNGQLHS